MAKPSPVPGQRQKPTTSSPSWSPPGELAIVIVPLLVVAALACLPRAVVTVRYPFTCLLGVPLFCGGWLALVSGGLIIKPRLDATKRHGPRPKLFCIGLSRTGTTSITVAARNLGLAAYHQCHALVVGSGKLDATWADAFDAHSDISPAIVFKQLAERYPEAKFVLTVREPSQWGKALRQFMAKHAVLFGLDARFGGPASRLFALAYGDRWADMSEEEWAGLYRKHTSEVRDFFAAEAKKSEAKRGSRLLELDVTSGRATHGDLAKFLGIADDLPEELLASPFPKVDVFWLSATLQPWWQLRTLVRRCLTSKGLAFIALALAVTSGHWLWPFIDYEQCDRACRLAHAPGGINGQGAAGVIGQRVGAQDCLCYSYPDGAPLGASSPRHYRPDNDTWFYETTQVCSGTDGVSTFPSPKAAADAGHEAINCGVCGKCSNAADVAAYKRYAVSLTARSTKCAVLRLLVGRRAAEVCMAGIVGLSPPCAECWMDNMGCTIAHCFDVCALNRRTYSPSAEVNNPDGGTKLSDCLACDEVYCSSRFLKCAGANRRTSGTVTDIKRLNSEICNLDPNFDGGSRR